MAGFVDEIADQTELIHLIRNNRDAALRLGRQVTDLVVQGQVKFDPADFPGLTREEVGRQYMHTLSEAGRILGMHGRYVQEFSDELHEMVDRMDLGAALARASAAGLHAGVPAEALEEALTVDFTRVTLVAEGATERVTVDVGLTFSRAGAICRLPGVAVIEIKQEEPAPSGCRTTR